MPPYARHRNGQGRRRDPIALTRVHAAKRSLAGSGYGNAGSRPLLFPAPSCEPQGVAQSSTFKLVAACSTRKSDTRPLPASFGIAFARGINCALEEGEV